MVGGWNGTRILEKAELLKGLGEYSKCIRTIESVPEGERGYRMTILLGWAYSDLAVLGDRDAGREDPDQERRSERKEKGERREKGEKSPKAEKRKS